MKIIVINSGSAGNCYLLTNGKETLIIEAGVPLKEVKKALNFDMSSIVGCVITHEHGDHAKYAGEYLKAGIKCCVSDEMSKKILDHHNLRTIDPVLILGLFEIFAYPVPHDVPCVAFYIKHPEIGRLFFLTDAKFYANVWLEADHFLIEANYCEDKVRRSLEDRSKTSFIDERVVCSHMSIQTCIKTLESFNAQFAKTITLIHLSDRNSDAEEFKRKVARAIGIIPNVAEKGQVIDLEKW